MTYRKLFIALAVGASLVGNAVAQALPERPVRMVLAYAAGGSSDPAARGLAAGLSKRLGQNVYVENKPGGNTIIATQSVASAPADGTTLYITYTTPYTMVPHLVKRLPYDPKKAMTPIAQIGELQYAFVVPANSPYKTMKELVEAAKASPGKLTFPSPGTAQIMGLASELFRIDAGIDVVHVPYTGSGQAAAALLAGHHDFFLADLGSINQFASAGKVRLLSIVGEQRNPAYPDVPTLAESGCKNIVFPAGWFGVVAPPGMDPQLVKKLNAAIVEEMKTPEMAKIMQAMGLKTQTSTPEQLAAYVQQDDVTWGQLIRKLGLTLQ